MRKPNKGIVFFVILAFLALEVNYSYGTDDAIPQESEESSIEAAVAGETSPAAPAPGASLALSGASSTGFASSPFVGPLGTTREIFQTDLFTGRASSAIPIVMSPGRGSVQPDVKLSYASGSGNGWCGVGWDLGMGSISRSVKKGAPTYNDSIDTFIATLGGISSDLVPIGDGEYRAKFDPSYLKFRYTGVYWEVWDKSGTRYLFGSTGASQVENGSGTYEWCLDRVTSVHGNYMTISYTKDEGQIYPDIIQYTGNDITSDTPKRTVKFNLETSARPDVSESYRSGARVATRYRLSEIEIKDNGNLVRKYILGYSASSNTGRSLLASVTQYGSDGTSTLPPVTFTYQDSVNGWTEDAKWIIPDGTFVDGANDQGRVLVDVNGDAMPDLMVAIAQQNGSWYERSYKNTGSGWVRDGGWSAPNGNFIWVTQGVHIDDGRRLADVNGDGFPDWLVANKYWYGGSDCTYGTYMNGRTYWHTSNSGHWIIPDGFFAEIGAGKARCLADVNGDGLTDLSISKDGYRATYLNNGSGWVQDNGWNIPDGDYSNGAQLVDINGDGLVDLLIAKDGVKASYVNNGRGWTRDDTWNIPDGDLVTAGKAAGRVLVDINGDGLPDLIAAKDGYKKTYINIGYGWRQDERWLIPDGDIMAGSQDKGRRFSDVNGDGMTDLVIAEAGYKKTYLNSSPVPDLLAAISNGVGKTTTIAYTPSTKYYNNGSDSISDLPILFQTVSSVTKSDGMGNSYTVSYSYWNGKFDVLNREFLGFNQVREIDADGNYADNWFSQDPIYKGRLYLQEKKDRIGNLYSRIWNQWDCFEPYGGAYLPYLKTQDQYIFDGDATFKATQVVYEYDSYGNVIEIAYSGDDSAGWGTILGDEKYTYIEYVYNQEKWILDKPCHAYTLDSAGNKVSEAWYYYDNSGSWHGVVPIRGNLTKEEKWLSVGANPTTTMAYDDYGNVIRATNPRGKTTATSYDAVYHTFPELMTNHLGHTQRFTYDSKTGQVLTATDPNGQVSTNEYDVFARIKKSFTPYDDTTHPIAWYEYDINTLPLKVTAYAREENNTDNPDKIHMTYTFFDGLGRTIEVKSEAEDSSKQIVSGIASYNNRGLVESKYLPYLITVSTPGEAAAYSAPNMTGPKATFQYDPMVRLVKTINPDNTYNTVTYSDWVTTYTDENGHTKCSTNDAYGRVTKIEEFNGANIYATTYQYDTLNNLVRTIDVLGNTVAIHYDSLARKISMNDPDMGVWIYMYDDAGNLSRQTDAKGQILSFAYDAINRLTKKDYPTGTDIIYTYDTYPAGITQGPYSKGRLTSVTDSSGRTIFYYDKTGREIKTVKTIDSVSYTTERAYDALGRLKSVTYSDGETINYTYNRQGGIETVIGARTYVANIDYNASGQMLLVRYGNNTSTTYEYDPRTLRLSHLNTQGSGSQALQDLAYTFDNVGNVAAITDNSTNGTNTQTFQYDDLYRLTEAAGESYGTISYRYDPIGNMIKKGDLELIYPSAGFSRPHAVKEVKRNGGTIYTPSYDANGNMIQKGNQIFDYDFENRLTQVSDVQSGGTVTVAISLKAGMNLVSLPVIPTDAGVSNVLSSLRFGTDYTQVSRYNRSKGKFEHWVNNPKFDQFNTLEYGVGYQIYVSNSSGCVLHITGRVPFQGTNVTLASGWNLIGSPTTSSIPIKEALSNLKSGIDYDKVAKYDPLTKTFKYFYDNPSMDQFSTMNKGCGYYIHTLKDTLWQIPIKSAGATTFVYDGDGGRVKKVAPDGSQSVYIGSLYEVSTIPVSGQKVIKSIFLGQNRICQVETDNVYYYHQDHIGSSNCITDQAGSQVALYEYSPYGENSRIEGSFSTDIRFTGKRLDNSTGLYFYGARYYDPELGRFITADPTIQHSFDPQDLNRYSYCRNNPINYTDPTGLSWLSKLWGWFTGSIGNIVGAVVGAATAIVSGNFWLGFQAYSMTSSVINAATTGNWGGLAGGIAGGLIGGALGIGAASGIYNGLGQSSFTFGGGFLGGAAEFGLSGFGAGFGSALGSGEKIGDALQSGLISGGISAAIGGVIQGSYNAGWQDSIHGADRSAVGETSRVERQVGLYRGYSDIGPGKNWHEGVQTTDNWNQFNLRAEFDTMRKDFLAKKDALFGMPVAGSWQIRNQPFQILKQASSNLAVVKSAYTSIQSQLGKFQIYGIIGIPANCRSAAEREIAKAMLAGK